MSMRLAGLLMVLTLLSQPAPADAPDDFRERAQGTTTEAGLLTFHRKPGTLLLEIDPSLLDQPLGFAVVQVNGAGDFSPRASGIETQQVRWIRIGDRLILHKDNLAFRAAPESGMHQTVIDTFGGSPVFDAPLMRNAGQRLVVDAGDLFDTGLASIIPDGVPRKAVRPAIESLKVFDDNTLTRVVFALEEAKPENGPSDHIVQSRWQQRGRLPDDRVADMTVDYHFFRLPDDGYQPREADERIGGMTLSYKDYSSVDDEDTLFRHLLRRFDLRKQDPMAEISPPVEPIRFTIDHSVPVEWRALVREGTLWWNTAFEKIGISNAIEVLDPPDDPDWDPADIRHNAIVWHLMDDLVFSGMAGPTLSDPRTGQTLKASTYLNGEFFSFALNRYLVYAWWRAPDPGQGRSWREQRNQLHAARGHGQYCDRAASFSSQIAFARLVLQSRGLLTPGTPEADRFAREAFLELVAHEIGHALGFPHNWKASLKPSWSDVRDGNVSGEPGDNMFSASVMDYDPIYFSPRGEPQGDYFMQGLGAYDDLYVDYIYRPLHHVDEAARRAELDRIAARAEIEPGLTHDSGMLNSIDPTVNADDLGDDPLAFAEQRLTILREEVFPNVAQLVLAEGHDYNLIRQALDSAVFSVALDYIDMTARHVGGQLTLKRVANSPAAPAGGPPPLRPVPAIRQRQALDVLDEQLFAPNAFEVTPQLLEVLKADMLRDWNYPWRYASDYAIGDRIAGLYDAAFSTLLEPARLARVLDNERRFGEQPAFTMPELFQRLERTAFENVPLGPERRAMQRLLVDHYVKLATDAPAGTPVEASQLAALGLVTIRERALERIGRRNAAAYEEAHWQAIERTIDHALEP